MLTKILSGGQTGVDRAALEAAKVAGFDTGGWMPKGFKAEDGLHPEFADLYGMREARTTLYPERTRLNILEADATFLITPDTDSAGSHLARRLCRELGKPLHEFEVTFDGPTLTARFHSTSEELTVAPAGVAQAMNGYGVVNVAGTRDARVHRLLLPSLAVILQTVRRWQESEARLRSRPENRVTPSPR